METNRRVLLALMQLDIGGAETHVSELAKELKRRGYYVVVASNGGAYVSELESAGIIHYSVPLNNKNPLNVFKAFSILKRIIIEEKIDIVHSHARIPSFILGKLQKKMGFPFVTTAHWVFKTSGGLKYITDWGQYTVAVSEDIKKYLMDNYGTPEDKIVVTINGIDTDTFSAKSDPSFANEEFGLSEDDNTIVYVSRMDKDRSLVARQLISIADKLNESISNLKLLIVGGGNDFDEVSAMASAMNAKLGNEVIKLTGARTDIARLIPPAKLFVGVSRAALEAMACEKSAIIAGNEGYIGLFDKTKLQVSIDTNFCCRGCEPSTKDKLLSDILAYFSFDDERKASLGRYARRTICENYSVGRMVDDNVFAYEQVLTKGK